MRKTILKIDLVLEGGEIKCMMSGCDVPDSLRRSLKEWSKGILQDASDRVGIAAAVSEVLRATVEEKI